MVSLLHDFLACDNKQFSHLDSYVVQICNETRTMVANPIGNFFMAAQGWSHSDAEALSLFRNIAPDLSVQSAECVPTSRAQQAWLIKTHLGTRYILSLPASRGATPLSLEKSSLVSESLLLYWLSSMPSYDDNAFFEFQGDHEIIIRHGCLNYVSLFIPYLKKHAHHDFEKRRPEYLLTQPTDGIAISAISGHLSREERSIIGYQSGSLMRRICGHVSPNGKFGPVCNILQGHFKQPVDCGTKDGFHSWTLAFHWMLESVAKDLEGKGVMVPYIEIRGHLKRLLHVLGGVTRPSLVVMDGAEDSNVLVKLEAAPENVGANETRSRVPLSVLGDLSSSGISGGDGGIGANAKGSHNPERNSARAGSMSVTGLRNWSNCIFGDPLMAIIFARELPPAFVHGLREPLPRHDPFVRTSPVQDPDRAEARSALYQCFHGLVLIAQNFYHYRVPPDVPEERDLQLVGRRLVKKALQRLDGIDDAGHVRGG